jgi:hypothetical protein
VSDYLPKIIEGPVTITATGTVTGGQLVTALGVTAPADSATWLGVASRDAISGVPFGVWVEGVQRLTAAGALAAGTLVKCAAAGQVTTWVAGTDGFEKFVGITLEAASGAGSIVATRMVR